MGQPFSSEDLARRRAASPRLGWAIGVAGILLYLAGLFNKRWMMQQTHPAPPSNSRLVRVLLLMVSVALAFAFALLPRSIGLSSCTGFNGKTAGQGPIRDGFGIGGLKAETAPPANVDVTRTITVEFTGTVMPGLPWDMRPLTFKLDAHPGELQQVVYLVRNTSDREITGQAVPSVTPGQAAQYFDKIECFCFSQQTLGP